MLKNMTRPEWTTAYWYELVFDDGVFDGFGFPCDEHGTPKDLSPAAVANLDYCRKHPEKFVRAGEVIRRERTYKEPAKGRCHCGQWVYLTDDYYGACQCPKCGQWYNLFGQELLSPEHWEEELEEDW